MIKQIKWRTIDEAPNYEISNTGLVRNKRTGNYTQPFTKNRNYPTVALHYNGKTMQRFVHRLVAFAFVPNDNPKRNDKVHHVDENKMNFRADNLMWTYQGDNISRYQYAHQGDTNIDRMKKILCNPIVEFDRDCNIIGYFKSPQATGYHCKELYDCLKNHKEFRGHIYVYQDELINQ